MRGGCVCDGCRRDAEIARRFFAGTTAKQIAALASTATASLAFATSALAADLPLKAPPPLVQDSWAGPYIGSYFAAGAGRANETAASSSSSSDTFFATSSTAQSQASYAGNVRGTMAELFAGRNWRFGNFVVGGQLEASIAGNIDLNERGPLASISTNNIFGPLDTISTTFASGNDAQLKFRAGAVGRAGFLAKPDLLLYGLAGIEFGHFLFSDDDLSQSSNSKWAVGYTAGAGVEARLDNRWSLRAEYRFLHFGLSRAESGSVTALSPNEVSVSSFATSRRDSADIQLAKLGLVYRLGGLDPGPYAAMAPISPPSKTAWADSWAGPYAGIAFGAGAGHAAEATSFSEFDQGSSFTSTSSSPFVGGGGLAGTMNNLFAGYNWRMGRFVGSAQVEGSLFSDVAWQTSGPFAFTSTSSSTTAPFSLVSQQGLSTTVEQLRATAGLISRAGFLATPWAYLYALGGITFGNFTLPAAGDSKWFAGYTAGVGGEVRLDDHWSVRAEYRYLHFGVNRSDPAVSTSTDSLFGPAISVQSEIKRSAADLHLGQIGFAYKFGGSGPAAALVPVPPVVPPAIRSSWNDGWAGPYLGVGFGGGAGKLRGIQSEQDVVTQTVQLVTAASGLPASPPFTGSNTITSTAALAGNLTGSQTDLFAGYNWRNGRLVWGGQIEATQFGDVAGTIAGIQNLATAGPEFTQTIESRLQLRSMIGLIGRAGYLARPDLLLYGLAGLELGHFTYPDGSETLPAQNGKWVAGYTLGAGGEWQLADHWSLRAEYRYAHFDIGRDLNKTTQFHDENLIPPGSLLQINDETITATSSQRTAADLHLGKVGLAYRFGGDDSSATAAFVQPVPTERWSGVSAGVYGAGGAGKVRDAVESTVVGTQTVLTAAPPVRIAIAASNFNNFAGDISGGMADLFAGYNHRLGDFVLGGQVEGTLYSDVALKSSLGIGTLNQFTSTPITEHQQSLRTRIGLIGRAGFLARPDLLLYGLAGLELGHFTDTEGVTPPTGGDGAAWAAGYTAGFGAELKFSEHWSVRGEYRYLHFGFNRGDSTEQSINAIIIAEQSTLTDVFHTSANFHVGKFGVAYRF